MAAEEEQEEEALCGSSSANAAETAADGKLRDPMELFDDCWFYRNLLLSSRTRMLRRSPAKPPPLMPVPSAPPMASSAGDCSLDSVWKSVQKQRQGKADSNALPRSDRVVVCGGALVKAPSMPSPRIRREGSGDRRIVDDSAAAIEEDDIVAMLKRSLMEDHRVRSEAAGRRTMLRRAPSMPVPRPSTPPATASLDEADASSKQSISRLRYSCSTLENHVLHHHYRSPTSTTRGAAATTRPRPQRDHAKAAIDGGSGASGRAFNEEASSRRASLLAKKWNSLADLESAEVQGFKDLGFVFGEEELNSRLLAVVPGLRGGSGPSSPVTASLPPLSEAWFVQRSAPPVVLKRASRSSAVDMKEQLRFWARAVACNVRHEC